jgi:hypothetical protein
MIKIAFMGCYSHGSTERTIAVAISYGANVPFRRFVIQLTAHKPAHFMRMSGSRRETLSAMRVAHR